MLKNKRKACIALIGIMLIIFNAQMLSQVSSPKGLWKFDDTVNPLKSEIGENLEIIGSYTSVTGPSVDNGAIRIGKGSYIRINHAISTNGGGTKVNEYTLQIDFKIQSLSVWHSLFQTSALNSDDGECFVNLTGNIGVQATGYSNYTIKPNEWYRLIISVKNGVQYNYYLDGQLTFGFLQSVDGRFSLDKFLLLFADDNGEDGEIDCAEAAIWDKALTTDEVKLLGNYGHYPKQLFLVPYLQNPSSNSIYICWHDSTTSLTKVEYGTTFSLGQTTAGNAETIYGTYVWHSVKLTGLLPNTEYYYRVISGLGSSQVYSFRTLPPLDYKGKIRFLLLSDTHASDTTMAAKVIKAAKKKMQELYGDDYYNKVNLVLHSGDLVISGYDITNWTDQYFAPMSAISPNIPTMTVTGNHEGEHDNYYAYMKYDEVSAYPSSDPLNKRFWSFNVANTAFIGLNSNLSSTDGTKQVTWLNNKLKEIESDSKTDFVFLIVHHMPASELWNDGMTDAGSIYVRDQIIPVMKKYSKVIQLSFGHTHGFERGTVESLAENSTGDFRIVCGGGGGGIIDNWGSYTNCDVPYVHISLDHYFYQIIEIDVSGRTFTSSMYSLGNSYKARNSELMDSWYRKLDQSAPQTPTAFVPILENKTITFNSSKINSDSLMTVRMQIADDFSFRYSWIDTMVHWKNIYGVDSDFNPVDLNKGIDLTKLSLNRTKLLNEKQYYYRVKYRDHNLRWSEWSNIVTFVIPVDTINESILTKYNLWQNFPNPFNPITKIIYQIPQSSFVTLRVYDLLGKEIATLVNEDKRAGLYEAKFDGTNLSSGVYFYKLQAGKFAQTKKLLLIK
jgi:hypothetical protein